MDKRSLNIRGLLILTAIYTATLFTTAAPTYGQTVHKITLDEALNIAKAQNHQVHRASVQQEIIAENIKEKQEQRLPEIDFHTSYARITDLTEFKKGLSDKAVTTTIPEWADVSAFGKMPIYNGGEIKYAVKKAEQQNAIGLLKIEKTKHDIQIQVTATFLGVFKLMELQKIIVENIKEEEDRLREVRAFKKQGTVTGNEVLRAELQLSDMQLKLLSNQKNIAIGEHELQTLLQLPEDESFEINTTNLLNQNLSLDSYETYLTAAQNKEEIRIAKQEEAIGLTERRLAKGNYYPKISLIASYGFNYPNYMFFPPNPYIYTLGKVGIEASFSLSNLYKNKTKMHIANKKIAEQKIATAIANDEIKDQIFKQYTQYLEIMDKLPVTEKAKLQAAENYRIVKLKYLNQLALITDMIDADNALLQAKFNTAATRIDALMKHFELRYAAGLL
ncbi:MAG: TolC family protein [Candidatus Pedobacter colombiensis]|uniref:TolC family protein n=1 Tax=Candidatus Pedobacter colombiensis TaxID=3121371 RepID=A0AAJ5W8Y6_9SPHI|nr:TolC family protein [Pedobacter sp.]WEK18597.1 MAG: TolC family protein [Pedobacter sp.]